ncbi:UDP-glucose 4-epimerase GalE [Polyangium jinanense]|uniref:UDP-glucose 4-epimerase n=1 Tax=Polyangium jinanense TaxID=2829994 RepID=A0A9X3XAS7_9BACT|nr:UDP-glucose 4-epimerase GalE [Polyangium jinanense]MDC3960621.1 UDP-glucose 4-epimerase GalE [Polyangium jinanense]MDC3986909.1 UDP-glucose 4-epimerase GalE [Polyangium jinanense]
MTTEQRTILVTGGAGYIGSHAALALAERGHRPLVLDNLSKGHREPIERALGAPVIQADTRDRAALDAIFSRERIDAVMHFAAFIEVGESVANPLAYYENNVHGTVTLLQAMQAAGVSKFVFSSTCATYGVPEVIPIPEDHPQNPLNPYGRSKLVVEKILAECETAWGLRSVSFRYFNAAGAHPSGLLGEDHDPETHLIPLVLSVALGKRPSIRIFGEDYDTPDGTCLRDYIHVSDLADAHVLGVDYLLGGGASTVVNLGNGRGFSVKEVIAAATRVTGRAIAVEKAERRPGDSPALVGSSERARKLLGWSPRFPDLETIIAHAWAWHQKKHG